MNERQRDSVGRWWPIILQVGSDETVTYAIYMAC